MLKIINTKINNLDNKQVINTLYKVANWQFPFEKGEGNLDNFYQGMAYTSFKKDLFGFEEISFNDTKSKFMINGGKILSLINQKSYIHGNFHNPCYNTLPTIEPNNKRSKVTQIVANVNDLYKDKNNEKNYNYRKSIKNPS